MPMDCNVAEWLQAIFRSTGSAESNHRSSITITITITITYGENPSEGAPCRSVITRKSVVLGRSLDLMKHSAYSFSCSAMSRSYEHQIRL